MAKHKTVVATISVSPGDITTTGLDWRPLLGITADTVYDYDGRVEGLPTLDSWFSDTHTNLKFGPAVRGRFKAHFDIVGESGEKYHREIDIRCR